MPRCAQIFALLLLTRCTSLADAQVVTIAGKEYLVDRIGGAEIPGASNDPGDFTQPTYVTQAPNDNNTLYVVERTESSTINSETGRILKFDQLTNTKSTYLDLTGGVVSDGGIATMAFHPDFADNGLFYVTANFNSGSGTRNRLLEFHDPGTGTPTLSRTLLEYSSLANNYHTINWVGFQPDDQTHKLYVTTGDGGTQASQPQFDPALIENPNSPYGKVLRFDLEADFSTTAVDTTHPGIDVVSLGHRNPYRASFDPSGGMFIGEVGFNTVEELNYLSAEQIASASIEDFGWTAREGTIATPVNGVGGPRAANDIDPFFDYLHPGVNANNVGYTGDTTFRGNSVTGGYLFDGRYFFGDFNNGEVYSGAWDGSSLTDITNHTFEFEAELNDGIAWVVSFGTDNAGNLYMLDFGDNFFSSPGTGEIFRLSRIALPGDFNSDGKVDGLDFLAWQRGESETPFSISDLEDWSSNYGSPMNSAVARLAVPEPLSLSLATTLLALLCVKRKRAHLVFSQRRA